MLQFRTKIQLFTLGILLTGGLSSVYPNSYYQQGKLAFGAKNYDRAKELFNKALQSNPSNGNPLFYVGYMLEYENRKAEANQAYRRAVDLHMSRDLRMKSLWKIILYYKFNNNWNGLYTYTNKFLKYQDSSDVRKLNEMAKTRRDPSIEYLTDVIEDARAAEEAGDTEKSAELYRKAVYMNNELEEPHWKLAIYYMKIGVYENARNHLSFLVKKNPESWQYRYKYAVTLYKLGEYNSSMKYIREAKQLNSEPGNQFQYYIQLSEGLNYLEMGELDKAKPLLEASIKPSIAAPYGAMARVYLGMEQTDQAREYAIKALKLDHRQIDALMVAFALAVMDEDADTADVYRNTLYEEINLTGVYKSSVPVLYQRSLIRFGVMSCRHEDYKKCNMALTAVDPSKTENLFSIPNKLDTDRTSLELNLKQLYPLSDSSDEFYYNLGLSAFSDGENRDTQKAFQYFRQMSDSSYNQYIIARYHAMLKNEYQARDLLEKALKTTEPLKKLFADDEIFEDLAENHPLFKEFYRTTLGLESRNESAIVEENGTTTPTGSANENPSGTTSTGEGSSDSPIVTEPSNASR